MITAPSAFMIAWSKTDRIEGGYSNNPADPGGETNHGVTLRAARAFGYMGAMKDLPVETAGEIMKKGFWDPLHLDAIAHISPAIADELFDTNVNMWEGFAVQCLQRSLVALGQHVPQIDGQVGPATLDALTSLVTQRGTAGVLVLLRCLNALQLSDYMRQTESVPGKRAFFFGWVLNRVSMDA